MRRRWRRRWERRERGWRIRWGSVHTHSVELALTYTNLSFYLRMEQNNNISLKPTALGIHYGLLTGLASIIFGFMILATAQESNTILNLLNYVILGVGIFFAQKRFKSANENHLSYGQGIGIGTLLALISGLLSASFYYIYCEFIDPDVITRLAESIRAKMIAEGNTDEAQLDQIVNITMKFSTGLISVVLGIATSVLSGLLLALIITAITKNPRPEFE